jgi:serine-type D-Ala-D-Ala carboxypeptidase/endopeptidase (penicillin-binding protein 4)
MCAVWIGIAGCSTSTPHLPISNRAPLSPRTRAIASPPLSIPLIEPRSTPNPVITKTVEQYLQTLIAEGSDRKAQGVWLQSGTTLLANHQGTTPLSAASLTKVATTLATLQKLGPNHRFTTRISTNGPLKQGVLVGDVVVQGGEDPFLVWEDVIKIGNHLNQRGIQQVNGNLIIVGKFYMNFEADPIAAGQLFRQGLNTQLWPAEAHAQYQTLPSGTPRPAVAIAGSVQATSTLPSQLQPRFQHHSLPLAELLKKMNRFSNNAMAEMLANKIGGAEQVARTAVQVTGVPAPEIQLVNGSGLSPENRISPRATCAMFLAIEQLLQPHRLTIADVFAVVGQDQGILDQRAIPSLSVVKSGTLDTVSALAGALPTQKQGVVWFAILNSGSNVEEFRRQQEALLNTFLDRWGSVAILPAAYL